MKILSTHSALQKICKYGIFDDVYEENRLERSNSEEQKVNVHYRQLCTLTF